MARKKALKSVEKVAGSKTRVRPRRQPTSKKSAPLKSEPVSEESGSQKSSVLSSQESGGSKLGRGNQKIPSRIESKKKSPAKRVLKKRPVGSDGRSTPAVDVFKETQRSVASGSSWTGEQQLEPSQGVCSSPGPSGASQITARSSTLNELMQQRWLSLSSEDQSTNNSPSSSNFLQPSNSSDLLDLDKQRKPLPLLNPVRTAKPPSVNAVPAGKSSPKYASDGSTAKRHECPSCDKTMSSRSDLVKHIRTHTGERPYTCSYCPASFTQLGSLRAHETRHTGIKPFVCQICKKAFSIKERLKVHMRVHTGVKPFLCKLCDKSFARGSQLIQHKRVHTGEKPYACSYCDMKFGFATNLKLHEKKHTGTKDYECPRCYKGFVRQDALRRHIQSYHENERPLHCPICDKSFKGHLGTHLRVHTQEKPFQCDACPAAFAQNSQLTVHQRTHTGAKPYPCQVCPQKFAHSTALKVHLRQHTGEKPYRCPVCGSFFNQLPHMKKHLRSIHQQPDPYMCGVCKLFFKTKSDRERHVEQDHGDLRAGQDMDPARAEMLEPETMPEVITRGGIPVSKLRAYLAILMKKISNQTRLVHFGFGSRLIDEVLKDSLETAGRTPFREGGNSVEMLRANVQLLLDWTIPSDYMEQYRRERKTIEEILEELAS